ncbi:mitochondrial folate transporter/carrier-like [Dunckerocampus dactyliophorus]|uniref:mitochondrial folate transporter/carrier-like n=1 Tax=Dunckerocampus dactyliophorus TaxID=161453 RepID=UPI0024075441|nr:mitochondrial folate transporter/carrier-like [Dunckerocampus dactyliophorus]
MRLQSANMSTGHDRGTVSVSDGKPDSAVSSSGHILQVFRQMKVEHLVAGLSGGVLSTMVVHPLDLVKIRFAVSDGLELRPKYSGILHCMKCVWQQEGLRGLYQGVTPNVWGAGASWGLYFFFYEAIKAYVQDGHHAELSATQHLVSAAEAGILTLTITNPIWVTKTRLVLQYSSDPTSKQYKGMLDALVKIYRMEGVSGLYKGYVPGLFGTSHGALQFMAYEQLKRRYKKYKKVSSDAKLNALENIMTAALSKIFAVATTYPYQVVRARLQDQHNTYDGVVDVIRRTWRNEGATGFYKGIIPNLIRVTPACCITFLVYENVSRLLLGPR